MFFGVVLAGAIGLSQGHTVALLDRVIDRRMWNNFVVIGAPVAAATLFTIHLHAPGGAVPSSLDTARTAGFTVLVIAQLFNTLNARSETWSAFHRLFANSWLWAAIGVSALLQVAVVQLPLFNTAFTTTPLSAGQWLVCVAVSSGVLWVSELRKLILRALDRRRAAIPSGSSAG